MSRKKFNLIEFISLFFLFAVIIVLLIAIVGDVNEYISGLATSFTAAFILLLMIRTPLTGYIVLGIYAVIIGISTVDLFLQMQGAFTANDYVKASLEAGAMIVFAFVPLIKKYLKSDSAAYYISFILYSIICFYVASQDTIISVLGYLTPRTLMLFVPLVIYPIENSVRNHFI